MFRTSRRLLAAAGVIVVLAGLPVGSSTGAILWSYQDTMKGSKFWAPTISNGHLYIGNQDKNLYAFGT